VYPHFGDEVEVEEGEAIAEDSKLIGVIRAL
jgi:hypothetical protein